MTPPNPNPAPPAEPPSGLVLVDKPADWTSHDCVAKVRRLAATKKVGHAGTLDPAATGLLVMGVGRATRLLTHLVGLDKVYTATIRLGAATTTDDAVGEVTFAAPAAALETAAVRAAMAPWRGRVSQVPSSVSAVKVGGRRAYARVRAGEDVVLAAREVEIARFDLLAARPAEPFLDLDVLVECSSGTYVRALARDLGAGLGVGGHLTALRRLGVGPFRVESAKTLDELAADFALIPLGAVARRLWPARDLTADESRRLAQGQSLPGGAATAPIEAGSAGAATAAGAAVAGRRGHGIGQDLVAGIGPGGELVALLRDEPGRGARPVAVFA
ncbi:MAG: tRNA pseudouridine(55) synthase TruB [Bifidobacteriaceae bacterium]|jgi:tRNA pseudouridine55 synthase|nr:tRNA pseudouridine(55) synthase TruB [Bifidobacteriaceae bacterium]